MHSGHGQNRMEDMSKEILPPEIDGDRTKRYTISMKTDPVDPQANQNVTLHFTVYDANSGNHVISLRTVYGYLMDFIVVNNDLTSFTHLYPTQEDQDFVVTTQFPTDDLYHLYIEFQPIGGIVQQFAFNLPVGKVPSTLSYSKTQPDTQKTKMFGDYGFSVDMATEGMNAAKMTDATQTISFEIKNGKNVKAAIDLAPQLDSFDQVTMINTKTYDVIHMHQFSLSIINNLPVASFRPFQIYEPFKPGIYRTFVEFNPKSNLPIADFTVKIN